MKVNALMMDDKDNVVTCVADIAAGETVVYKKNNEVCTITAKEDIPYCHKIALTDIGESLGRTSEAIPAGHWVSHNNLFSVPRDYDSEMIKEEK